MLKYYKVISFCNFNPCHFVRIWMYFYFHFQRKKGLMRARLCVFTFFNFRDIWIILTKLTWNIFHSIPPQRVLTRTNSNNEMTNVRTTDLAQETEDPKIIYSNMYMFEKYEKVWDFICRFLHHKIMVAESFHLASFWQR